MMQKKTTAQITWRVLAGLLLALVLVFSLTGCGPDPESEAKASLEKTFFTLKSADAKTLSKHNGKKDFYGDADKIFGSKKAARQIVKSLFAHFDYKILSSKKVNDNNVTLRVKITNVDMNKVVPKWYKNFVIYAAANPTIATDENAMMAKTVDILKTDIDQAAKDKNFASKTVTIKMEKVKDEWKIKDPNDKMLDTMLGVFQSVINNFK
ncbi:hypothetical protein [Pseudoramibacter faecis]|uniref:hypothetical protein n=1 Tax=Pseudoramibacter faecis TaxID=3108534 RepID=UPI002E76F2F2|nr:hypothetical protein [Pseudoramibacter sp. HA2172]